MPRDYGILSEQLGFNPSKIVQTIVGALIVWAALNLLYAILQSPLGQLDLAKQAIIAGISLVIAIYLIYSTLN